MILVTISKGRKINKTVCLTCLIPAVIMLAASGICALLEKSTAAYVLRIFGMILGGFALLYGILWRVYAVKEKKMQQELEAKVLPQEDPDGSMMTAEFVLPKEELTGAARKRFLNIVKWCCICSGICIAGIEILLLFNGTKPDLRQILYTVGLFVLILIPGIGIQAVIYAKYKNSVPGRILLFPGKLVVDESVFGSYSIRNVRITSSTLYNANSPSVYRELRIDSQDGQAVYRIDFRQPGRPDQQPHWNEYPQFADALIEWGKENRVAVTVDFMD